MFMCGLEDPDRCGGHQVRERGGRGVPWSRSQAGAVTQLQHSRAHQEIVIQTLLAVGY